EGQGFESLPGRQRLVGPTQDWFKTNLRPVRASPRGGAGSASDPICDKRVSRILWLRRARPTPAEAGPESRLARHGDRRPRHSEWAPGRSQTANFGSSGWVFRPSVVEA